MPAKQLPYSPVEEDFEILLTHLIDEKRSGVVNYFVDTESLEDARGLISSFEKNSDGRFLFVGSSRIRIDQIVTVLGKPGPAYDRYNHFSNVCFSCFDEGQF